MIYDFDSCDVTTLWFEIKYDVEDWNDINDGIIIDIDINLC